MTDPNYKPPATEVRDAPPPRGSIVKGVVVGLVVDIVGTVLAGIALGIVYGVVLGASGRSADEIRDALAASSSSTFMQGAGLVLGCACSVLGGWVCERIARQRNYRAAWWLAVASVVSGLVLAGSTSLAETALLAFLTVGSVLLGTRLAIERQER